MLEKLKNLSLGAKIGIASGVVLVAAAGVGLGITQPWNASEPPQDDPPPVQDQTPQEPAQKQEEQLSVRAGNDVVPCSLYEGDGWSIYLPEGWSAVKNGENDALLSSGDGAQLNVSFLPGSDFMGDFVNLSCDGDARSLQFYQGIGEGSPVVTGSGPQARWDFYGKLFTALARTLTVGEETPFGEVYIIPHEPDWQKAEGNTVLFLDKDGYVLDDKLQDAIEDYMKSWPAEEKGNYTGQYRINQIQWAGSYAGITENGYIDVFRADVQYKLRDGVSAEDAVNGWVSTDQSVFSALAHDGGFVEKTWGVVSDSNPDWAAFAGMLQ